MGTEIFMVYLYHFFAAFLIFPVT